MNSVTGEAEADSQKEKQKQLCPNLSTDKHSNPKGIRSILICHVPWLLLCRPSLSGRVILFKRDTQACICVRSYHTQRLSASLQRGILGTLYGHFYCREHLSLSVALFLNSVIYTAFSVPSSSYFVPCFRKFPFPASFF